MYSVFNESLCSFENFTCLCSARRFHNPHTPWLWTFHFQIKIKSHSWYVWCFLLWGKFYPCKLEKAFERYHSSNLENALRDVRILYDCYFLLPTQPMIAKTYHNSFCLTSSMIACLWALYTRCRRWYAEGRDWFHRLYTQTGNITSGFKLVSHVGASTVMAWQSFCWTIWVLWEQWAKFACERTNKRVLAQDLNSSVTDLFCEQMHIHDGFGKSLSCDADPEE